MLCDGHVRLGAFVVLDCWKAMADGLGGYKDVKIDGWFDGLEYESERLGGRYGDGKGRISGLSV